MSTNRAVVIGGGAVGSEFHVPRLLGIAACSEVTIVDNSPMQCDALRSKFRRNQCVKIASELPAGMFDLAVVATPPKYHFDGFSSLKEVCSHIVIEKPLTRRADEAQALNVLAEKHGVTTYVGLIRRSLTNFALAKSWIDSRLFGQLQSVFVAEGMIFNWNAVSAGSFSRELNGGGVLMDTGPHTLDQLFQVFESLDFVSARLDAIPSAGTKSIEANATVELMSGGEVPITVLLSRNRSLSNTAKFVFDGATVELGLHSNAIRVIDNAGSGMHGIPNGESADVNYLQMFDAYYRKFIVPRNNLGISGPESVRLQRLIDTIYGHAELMEGSF